jgi:hypothetical protein
MCFNTPILLLIFNRLDTTQKVFNEIKKVKPKKLFVSADGSRENKIGETEKCLAVQNIILKQINWDCELFTNFRERNLGCKLAISSGIDWFFKHEERGIILEDDVLPDSTFFRFCEELLEYYKDDKRIMMISGDNFQFSKKSTEYSYCFSKYSFIWGWASWRRAWNFYDVDMKLWPKVRDKNLLFNILDNKKQVSYWSSIFEKVFSGKINAWSYQWLFACWVQNGLTILPRVNLVSNIGFGRSGTHTRGRSILANLGIKQAVFPLSHPSYLCRDTIEDKLIEKYMYSSSRIYKKIINIIYGR